MIMNENVNHHKSFVNQRSEAVNEILGTPPRWIIRWGVTIVFVIIFLLIIGSVLIKYNDIATAKIVITTRTPPAYVEANTSGKINELLIKTDEKVDKGDILAEIENTADMTDVLALKAKLNSFQLKQISIDSVNYYFPSDLVLGDMTKLYSDFLSDYQEYILYQSLNPNGHEVINTTGLLHKQEELLNKQTKQLSLYREQLKLSELNYKRNKTLYEKGVIAEAEFNDIKVKFIEEKKNYEKLNEVISNTQISITSLIGKRTQSSILDKELIYNHRHELRASLENLKSEISRWELKYLMKSPMDGKVSMFDIRNKYQNVNQGDVIFTIIPNNTDSIIGLVTMPVKNSGKVKIGQDVIIKLDNFPYQEWGSLKGKIRDISAVPKKREAMYSIYVSINSLNTSFSKRIDFRQEMHGTAEIILEEITFFQRIFYVLNDLFTRSN